ncbi:MAG: hypothetical protein IRF12RH_07855 [Rickettsia helvetica]|uniref:Uncharacterized protein n=1 Tax=Rickettsia helvetica TaxID=35789 RepID=A0ABM9NDL4_RICHE
MPRGNDILNVRTLLESSYRVTVKKLKLNNNHYSSGIIVLAPANTILNSAISDTVFPSYILNPTPLNATFALISAPY